MAECSICSSPVVNDINDALAKSEPLRSIAKRSGFSRAGLSRHSRKCVGRLRVEKFSNIAADLMSGKARLLRKNLSGGFYDQNTWQDVPDADVRDCDIELVIVYDPEIDMTARAAEVAAAKANAESALQPAEIPTETTLN